MKNCIDITRPFIEALGSEGLPEVQIFGGNGSAALADEHTRIIPEERLVIAPPDFSLPQYRPDGNKRDADIFVLSTDPDEIAAVEKIAEDTIGTELTMSVFGLHKLSHLIEQTQRPFSIKSLKTTLADRYVAEEDGEIVYAEKALFPFSVELDLAMLQGWRLQIGSDKPTPIPHPGTTITNYVTRSGAGLRPKDTDKIGKIAHNVLDDNPDMLAWMLDGPGKSQIVLARILHTLRESRRSPKTLLLGEKLRIQPYRMNELSDQPAFMLGPNSSASARRASVEIVRVKSRALHAFESNEHIVTLWQRFFESHFDSIVKNQ